MKNCHRDFMSRFEGCLFLLARRILTGLIVFSRLTSFAFVDGSCHGEIALDPISSPFPPFSLFPRSFQKKMRRKRKKRMKRTRIVTLKGYFVSFHEKDAIFHQKLLTSFPFL